MDRTRVSVGSIGVPGVPSWESIAFGGMGALLGVGVSYWLAKAKGNKNMNTLEKTLISLVTQLFEHIDKLETENVELRKRPTAEQFRAVEEHNGVLRAQKNDADRAYEVLRANLADRDRLVEQLRKPGVVQKTNRRR